mmetsp:Transcript_14775/g.52644  ORF Transcript_14775/g.52644 Transcript_14775/m.52644 type:complete len:402 (-) Transcript_14775:655-1860(-)
MLQLPPLRELVLHLLRVMLLLQQLRLARRPRPRLRRRQAVLRDLRRGRRVERAVPRVAGGLGVPERRGCGVVVDRARLRRAAVVPRHRRRLVGRLRAERRRVEVRRRRRGRAAQDPGQQLHARRRRMRPRVRRRRGALAVPDFDLARARRFGLERGSRPRARDPRRPLAAQLVGEQGNARAARGVVGGVDVEVPVAALALARRARRRHRRDHALRRPAAAPVARVVLGRRRALVVLGRRRVGRRGALGRRRRAHLRCGGRGVHVAVVVDGPLEVDVVCVSRLRRRRRRVRALVGEAASEPIAVVLEFHVVQEHEQHGVVVVDARRRRRLGHPRRVGDADVRRLGCQHAQAARARVHGARVERVHEGVRRRARLDEDARDDVAREQLEAARGAARPRRIARL